MEKNTFFLLSHHADENLQNIQIVGILMERNTLWKKKIALLLCTPPVKN